MGIADMEEKVAYALQLIDEDGDSFARRAEMYYKRRPEIVGFVEEAFRAYRALATRYDHISKELQTANTTIAAVCPDQVQFAMDDDDEDALLRTQKKNSENPAKNVPKVPKMPKKDLKGIFTSASRQLRPSKSTKKPTIAKPVKPKSGLCKSEGLKEIDRLQKQILVLQTEKEFVNSSYESWLAKYWEIEDQINEVQQRICTLQDEFGEGIFIEDDEARNLMTATALKSCQQTLDRLQDKQEKSGGEEKVERKRISDTREKLESLENEDSQKKPSAKDDSVKAVGEVERSEKGTVSATQQKEVERSEQGTANATQEREELESLREMMKEQFEDGSTASLSMTEMAEKIDEVVNKVVNLEIAFSSQTALVQRLRTEADGLRAQIRTLEDDKATLISDKNDLSSKLMRMQEKLHILQDANRSVEGQKSSPQTHLTEANCNLVHLSDKVQSVKSDEKLEYSSPKEDNSPVRVNSHKVIEGQEAPPNPHDGPNKLQSVKLSEEHQVKISSEEEKKSPPKVQFVEGIGRSEGGVNHDIENLSTEKPDEELHVKTSSEEEKKSPCKVQLVEGIGVSEGRANLGDEKLPMEKPDEELKFSGSTQDEEKSTVAVSVEEFKEQEEKQNHGDVPEKARDAQTKVVNDTEHELSATSGNQGEAVGQYQANEEPGKLLEKTQDQMKEEIIDRQASSEQPDNLLNVERHEQASEKEYEPDWKQMFLNGMENREKTLLAEYTTVLRNCKELKKKLDKADRRTGDSNHETTELQELRSANSEKDEEIRSLRQKLGILQAAIGENNDLDDQYAEQEVTVTETPRTQSTDGEVDINAIQVDQADGEAGIEEKFRMDIDELLEENLDFWLRFSTSFHQIQKFETEVKDLQAEVSKLEEKQKKHEGSSSIKYSMKSDGRPLYKHLREIQTELTMWLEKCASLQEEMKSRFSSLCDIQEEITKALKMSAEDDDFKFTSYQAAKFQGEVLNMKQENNKVADELQAGLDHVTNLQHEVEKTLKLLGDKFGLSETKNDPNSTLEHSDSRSRVPLRSFIFGVKPKKQRTSFFSSMHPALARKYNGFMAGVGR